MLFRNLPLFGPLKPKNKKHPENYKMLNFQDAFEQIRDSLTEQTLFVKK